LNLLIEIGIDLIMSNLLLVLIIFFLTKIAWNQEIDFEDKNSLEDSKEDFYGNYFEFFI
jgi:hypothetical protein